MTVHVTTVRSGENWFPVARRIAGPQASDTETALLAHRLALRNGYTIDSPAPLGMSLMYLSEDLEELVPSHVTISFPNAVDVSAQPVTAAGGVPASSTEASTPTQTRVDWAALSQNSAWDGTSGYLLTPNWDSIPLTHPLTGVSLPLTSELVGVPSSTTLTPHNGNIDETVDGAVIEELDVDGFIEVNADNVTIRNLRITYSGPRPVIRSNGSNLTIDHCEIHGVGNNPPGGVAYGNYTLTNSIVMGGRDTLKASSNTTISNNLIVLQCKEGTSHSDGIQSSGGSGIVITNNVIAGPYQRATSAIKITGEQSNVSNVTIEGNFLSGGSYTLYTTSDPAYTTSGFEIHNNLIENGAWIYGARSNTASNVNETNTELYTF